jgi:hypothetical protein
MGLSVSVQQTSSKKYGVKVYGLKYPLKVEDARDLADALYRVADDAESKTNIPQAEAEPVNALSALKIAEAGAPSLG